MNDNNDSMTIVEEDEGEEQLSVKKRRITGNKRKAVLEIDEESSCDDDEWIPASQPVHFTKHYGSLRGYVTCKKCKFTGTNETFIAHVCLSKCKKCRRMYKSDEVHECLKSYICEGECKRTFKSEHLLKKHTCRVSVTCKNCRQIYFLSAKKSSADHVCRKLQCKKCQRLVKRWIACDGVHTLAHRALSRKRC